MSEGFNYRGVWIYPQKITMRHDDPKQPHPEAEATWWSCELDADGPAEKVRTRPLASLAAAKDAAKSWVDAMYANLDERKVAREDLEEFGKFVREIDAGDGDYHEIDEMVNFFLGEKETETARESSRMVVEDCFCDHCKRSTPHEIIDSGHERDSSYDRRICLRCRWAWTGMTGKYEPPYEEV